MRRLFAASVLTYAAVWLLGAATLPDRVPTHFGLSGTPDHWDSRGTALALFAALGAGMTALLWVVGVVLPDRVGTGRATGVNVPHRDWWLASPGRRERLARLLSADVLLLGAATLVVLAVVQLSVVVAARRPGGSLPWWPWPALVGYLLLMGWRVVAMTTGRRYRPDGG